MSSQLPGIAAAFLCIVPLSWCSAGEPIRLAQSDKQKGKPTQRAAASKPTIEQVLAWLPLQRTESLFVARGPLKVRDLDGREETEKVDKIQEVRLGFADWLESYAYGGVLEFCESLKELAGEHIAFTVKGCGNFKQPHGLGTYTDEGCHVLVFEKDLGERGEKLRKRLITKARQVIKLSGQEVYRFEETSDKTTYRYYLTMPQTDVLLCATSESYLKEVLQRREQGARPTLDNRFSQWRKLNKQAPFWAIRCFDETWFGQETNAWMTAAFDPSRHTATLAFHITGENSDLKEILDHFRKEFAAKVREVKPGVTKVRIVVGAGEAAVSFMWILQGLLGHVCLC
jgi:hypothetical protein